MKREISSITVHKISICVTDKNGLPMAGQLESWHFQGILCANSQPRNCIKRHIGTIRHHKLLGKSGSQKNLNQSWGMFS